MYTEFYGLSAFPFQLAPDPQFFFESSGHRKAMAHLLFGLEQREGVIVVTGEAGTGKTILLGHLLATLDPGDAVAAKIVSTHLGGEEMLRAVAAAFDLPFSGIDKVMLLRHIETFLAASHQQGKRVLLLVDEAQNLSLPALEELRMLSNFQVGPAAPLQSLLLAQPPFRRTLAHPDLEPFRQRITASCHLGPMGAAETGDYIRHRLRMAGWQGDPDFSEEALAGIFRHSGGVPRKINTLCSRLMLFCFLDELHRVERGTVEAVVEDLVRENQPFLDPSGGGLPSGREMGEMLWRLDERVERLERSFGRQARAVESQPTK